MEVCISEFPGCCGAQVLHDFPSGSLVKSESNLKQRLGMLEKQLKTTDPESYEYEDIESEIQVIKLELESPVVDDRGEEIEFKGLQVASLLEKGQKGAATRLLAHGWIKVGTWRSPNTGNNLGLYVHGLNIPGVATTKKASKKTAKKRAKK